tara:strand:+ start:2506 stop:2844 length:339 start_codon:yes stop_codon:yes gene_type:complete
MQPDVEDWGELSPFLENLKLPIVVQFGKDQCAHCPDAALRVDGLMKTHQFTWQYHDATTSHLAEELNVHKLPAVLIFHSATKYKLYEQLRGDDINKIINAECAPRLLLDQEF